MECIIYDSRIDWDSLKQRPQYLSEELASKFKVYYSCMKLYRRNTTNSINSEGLEVKRFYHIPLLYRNKYTRKINTFLKDRFYKRLIKKAKPNIIIVSDVNNYEYIRRYYSGPIIYDCMDDHVSLNKGSKDSIINLEKKVISDSTITLASSKNLADVLVKRYGENIGNKIVIVRNGCDVSDLPMAKSKNDGYTRYILCYFGTIGPWFDFDVIKHSLEDFENIEYLLIGNVRGGVVIPDNPRIRYIGPVSHDKLAESTKDCNAFIMPFVVNDIVLSVDPVKLYEYISLGKDILCIEYPEIERFSDYIYKYNNYESFKKQLSIMMNENETKYDCHDREMFLNKNSWKSRAEEIYDVLLRFGLIET